MRERILERLARLYYFNERSVITRQPTSRDAKCLCEWCFNELILALPMNDAQ